MSETVKNSEKTPCRIISDLSGFRALLGSRLKQTTNQRDHGINIAKLVNVLIEQTSKEVYAR